MIWGVILAAGESKRMGEPKMLLPLEGKTMIEAVIDRVLASEVARIRVVLGAARERLEAKIRNYSVDIVFNPDFSEGMLSSVRKGLESLPSSAEAAVIILGDQPAVTPDVINSLIQAFKKERKGIVFPVYGRARGHPLLIDLKYREEIGALDSSIGLRELIQRHPQDIREVAVNSPAVLCDIDNRKDYREALKKLRKK